MKPLKRTFDLAVASLALIGTAPLWLSVAAALWLESPGEVIFKQRRLGQNGQTFELLKFRKFRPDEGDGGPGVTVRGDNRLTAIGRLLERTKLDELPQLVNVLRGEMTIVGPRPESLRFQHLFQGPYREVLDFVPGILGPSQIRYRNEADLYPEGEDPEVFYSRVLFPQKAREDIAYFSRASFLEEVCCAVRTVPAILFGTGGIRPEELREPRP